MQYDIDQSQIVENLLAGGTLREQTIATLYRQLFPRLLAHLLGQGCPRHKAEDCVQEAFIKALRNIHQFRGDSKLSTWLFTITDNVWRDLRRSAFESKSIDLETAGANEIEDDFQRGALHQIEQEQFADCVRSGYRHYQNKYPDCASWLYRLTEGESIAELAAAAGRNLGAMREYLSQCRKKLAPFIEQCSALRSA